MSVYRDIDSIINQVDSLIAESNKPPAPTPPPPPPEDDKQPVVKKLEIQQNGDNGSTTKTTQKSNGSQQEASQSTDENQQESQEKKAITANGNDFKPTLEAVGQTLTTTWNEKVLPELKKVDPKVYWGVGGGVVLLIILNSNRN